MNLRSVLFSLSRILGILAVAMILPLIISIGYGEPSQMPFLIPILIMAILSLYSFFTEKPPQGLNIRESVLIVVSAWVVSSAFGAIPFLIGHVFHNFTDAFFETISGFTATGSTMLPDIDSLPKSILFWRSETHWLGGMGIVVLAIAIFPSMQRSNALFNSEAPISINEERLFPRIATIALSYWKVYVFFTIAEVFLLWPVTGWFDAVTHAFATIAGGGFSTHNESIAYFHSVYVEDVIMIFMIAGASSFVLHYHALHGKFLYFKNSSFKAFIVIIASATFLVALNLYEYYHLELTFPQALRKAAFQVVSIITTTGFATENFKYWPSFSVLVLILLMFVGGTAASTSGSIKVWRYEVLVKNFKLILHRMLHPRLIEHIRSNKKLIDESLHLRVQGFIASYILIFLFSGLVLTLFGHSMGTSFSAVAATLGNVGPGIDAVGPFDNFIGFSAVGKWLLSVDMLCGRLEIWTFFTLILPEFWTG